MSNIVPLHAKERLIWVCSHCGCSTYYLYSDNTVECAACETESAGGEWVTPIQGEKQSPEKTNHGSVAIKAVGSIEFAKRMVVKRLSDQQNDAVMIAAWFANGSMTSWCGAETSADFELCKEKAREYADNLAVRQSP